MGQDEASAKSHRTAPVTVNKSKEEGPDTQQAKIDDDDKSSHAWSWLGNRSPLMGEMEEAQWVLERLSMTLEKALKKQSQSQGRNDKLGNTTMNGTNQIAEEDKTNG